MLAVDAGQTGTRAALAGAAGESGRGPGVRHLRSPGGVEHAADAICAAAAGAGAIDTLCAGISGYAHASAELERLAALLRERLRARRVVLASDVVTSYLGALGPGRGVVVAAGTGTVALAADGRGAVALVDGWGHLLGDAGSGFAIGRAGLASALRAFDGRDDSPALRARAERMYGSLERMPEAIYGAESPAGRVAAFAEAVADAARAGDGRAREIWSEAARDVAATVVAAAERALGPDPTGDIACAGSLFEAEDLMLDPVARHLAERAPGLRPRRAQGSSLAGAALLATPDVAGMFPGLVWP